MLKSLTGSKWGADKQTMFLVYRVLIKSCLDYEAEVYDSGCKIIRKHRLDAVPVYASLFLCIEMYFSGSMPGGLGRDVAGFELEF